MKKTLLIALLLAAFAPIFAFEYTYEGNTLEYTILSDNTVSVKYGTAKLKGIVKVPAQVVDPNTDISYNVTKVADEGFRHDATHVYTRIELPEGLLEIGGKAFVHCTNIVGEVILPSTLTTIGSRAFYNCQNITNLVITSPNPPLLVSRYVTPEHTTNDLDWFEGVDLITVPANQGVAYRKDVNGKSLSNNVINWVNHVAPNNVIIEPNEFLVNDGELNLYYRIDNDKAIISGIKTNGKDLFALNIPANVKINGVSYPVKEVADSAFLNDNHFTSLQLPDGLTCIGMKAFAKAASLSGNIVIPKSVNDIRGYAFYGSNKVSNFYLKPSIAPSLGHINAFEGNAPIHVHCEATGYQTGNWDKLSSDRIKDACLTIYHNGTPNKSGNGVYEATVGLVASITYKRTFTAGTWETLYLPFPVEKVTIEDEDEPNGYWSPNPWNITDGGDYYLATPASTTAANGELIFDMTTDLKEGTPYIIQFPGQYADYYYGREVTFHGPSDWYELGNTSFAPVTPTSQMKMAGNTTLQKQTISDEVYVLRATNDFMLQHSATTLYPFECYVMPQQTNGVARAPKMTVRLRGKNDVTTSFSSANAANPINYLIDGNSLTVYANGQSVQIYSINGILLHSISVGEDMAQVLLDKGCYIIYSNGNSQKVIL